jgi:hypothetical protein
MDEKPGQLDLLKELLPVEPLPVCSKCTQYRAGDGTGRTMADLSWDEDVGAAAGMQPRRP